MLIIIQSYKYGLSSLSYYNAFYISFLFFVLFFSLSDVVKASDSDLPVFLVNPMTVPSGSEYGCARVQPLNRIAMDLAREIPANSGFALATESHETTFSTRISFGILSAYYDVHGLTVAVALFQDEISHLEKAFSLITILRTIAVYLEQEFLAVNEWASNPEILDIIQKGDRVRFRSVTGRATYRGKRHRSQTQTAVATNFGAANPESTDGMLLDGGGHPPPEYELYHTEGGFCPLCSGPCKKKVQQKKPVDTRKEVKACIDIMATQILKLKKQRRGRYYKNVDGRYCEFTQAGVLKRIIDLLQKQQSDEVMAKGSTNFTMVGTCTACELQNSKPIELGDSDEEFYEDSEEHIEYDYQNLAFYESLFAEANEAANEIRALEVIVNEKEEENKALNDQLASLKAKNQKKMCEDQRERKKEKKYEELQKNNKCLQTRYNRLECRVEELEQAEKQYLDERDDLLRRNVEINQELNKIKDANNSNKDGGANDGSRLCWKK
ncbi:hypothetical protein GZ77_10855 [Endozoicomonas montiporae]|uniref:Uncharacterized protein n=2 Tax=Endozoicomonas montiporae TaxID=1027273 RepID=A0A081N8K5_9GAMM|nr:hypothetical protein [Endozoicomonas montiporae]KEQ14778.1 hypothetical protein GZ77_10855 [Endozoicomonas montiporae]